jgi:hypothetical protein
MSDKDVKFNDGYCQCSFTPSGTSEDVTLSFYVRGKGSGSNYRAAFRTTESGSSYYRKGMNLYPQLSGYSGMCTIELIPHGDVSGMTMFTQSGTDYFSSFQMGSSTQSFSFKVSGSHGSHDPRVIITPYNTGGPSGDEEPGPAGSDSGPMIPPGLLGQED